MRSYWLIASLLVACSAGGDPDDKAPGDWVAGKGDGSFDLKEAGPAPVAIAGTSATPTTPATAPAAATTINLDGSVPAYRVESFGNTQLSIALTGTSTTTSAATDAYLIVEGPLDASGDHLAIGSGPVVAEDDDSGPGRDAALDITLARPGIYRILTGTYESLGMGDSAAGSLSLSVTCKSACNRPQIDQKTFIRALQAQAQSSGALAEYAKNEIASMVHDPAAAAAIGHQLDTILADPNLTGIERFPTFSLAQINALRPAIGALANNSTPPAADAVVHGDLQALLGACAPDRAIPAELDPRLPGIRYGQFPDGTLAPCQFAHADKLAKILTSLGADNGSSITYHSSTITTPKQLFAALIATGHTIEVRNERMYANFLSTIVGDKDLIWPVWLDTGIKLASGEDLVIPMGHSHHAWRISGPTINTRVMFYLGIDGTGFWGQTSSRPAWSGTIAESDITVTGEQDANYDYLLDTVDTAATYLRRNRVERTTVAAGMPADGYGYVGVCNDSNATLEMATRHTTSAFPLLRAKSLNTAAALNDGLDTIVANLPHDADGIPDRADALRRIVHMQPYPDGSPLIFDAKLGQQIAAARAELR